MSTGDDFQACATCGVERAVDTLDNKGMCPFCVEEGREPPAKYASRIYWLMKQVKTIAS